MSWKNNYMYGWLDLVKNRNQEGLQMSNFCVFLFCSLFPQIKYHSYTWMICFYLHVQWKLVMLMSNCVRRPVLGKNWNSSSQNAGWRCLFLQDKRESWISQWRAKVGVTCSTCCTRLSFISSYTQIYPYDSSWLYQLPGRIITLCKIQFNKAFNRYSSLKNIKNRRPYKAICDYLSELNTRNKAPKMSSSSKYIAAVTWFRMKKHLVGNILRKYKV